MASHHRPPLVQSTTNTMMSTATPNSMMSTATPNTMSMSTPNINNNINPNSPSSRIRALWATFERSLMPAYSTMEHKTHAAHDAADLAYSRLPPSSRPTEGAHAAEKAAAARALRASYKEKAVAGWHKRLADAGLHAEMWTDITQDEMERIAMVLGAGVGDDGEGDGDADEEGSDEDLVVVTPPVVPSASSFGMHAPSLSTATRGTNVSAASVSSYASASSSASYEFVRPSEFYSEEEDENEYYPAGFGTPATDTADFLTSASASDNDDDERGPFRAWTDAKRPPLSSHNSSLHNSTASLNANGASGNPQRHQRDNSTSRRSPTGGWGAAATSSSAPGRAQELPSWEDWGAGGKRTMSSASASASAAAASASANAKPATAPNGASHRNGAGGKKQPVSQHYIGPQLLTTDEPPNLAHFNGASPSSSDNRNESGPKSEDMTAAALDFERFKLRTRMLKIVEFHAVAAAAEIRLAAEIWRVRKGVMEGVLLPNLNGNGKQVTSSAKAKGKAKAKRSGLFGDEESEHEGGGDNNDDHASYKSSPSPPITPSALVLAHQNAMATLQAAKEEERKVIVREERERRRAGMGIGKEPANGVGKTNTQERRKGRSGTIVSGHPTAPSNANGADTSPPPPPADAWLDKYASVFNVDSTMNGDEEKAVADALLGGRFKLGAILGNGQEDDVNKFLEAVMPSSGGEQQQQDWGSAHNQNNQKQPQGTPTATSFGTAGHRRRASTSASAAALLAAPSNGSSAAPRALSRAAGVAGGNSSIYAPIPVRASPFGESSSSSDEDGARGGYGRGQASGQGQGQWGASTNGASGRWDANGQQGVYGHEYAHNASQPQIHAQTPTRTAWGVHSAPPSSIIAPPLHALERELEPELMAAFVEFSGVGAGRGTLNPSSSTGGSAAHSPLVHGPSSLNHSPMGAQANIYGMDNSLGGGYFNSNGNGTPANVYAAASEALAYIANGSAGDAFGAPRRGRTRTMEPVPLNGSSNANSNHTSHATSASSRNMSSSNGRRSRSRSPPPPTTTRGFPSWTSRLTGSQAQLQAQVHHADTPAIPARGPTATPISSGWTRKFQKPAANGNGEGGNGGAPASSSSMFSLKNNFGFTDDADSAPTPAPALQQQHPQQQSSWLSGIGGKGKLKASSHSQQQHEPGLEAEVSLWEQVVSQQQQQRATPAVGVKKALPAEPEEIPKMQQMWGQRAGERERATEVDRAVEKEQEKEREREKEKEKEKAQEKQPTTAAVASSSKKQTKKQRQALKQKGGSASAANKAAEPEPEAEQEAEAEAEPVKEKPPSSEFEEYADGYDNAEDYTIFSAVGSKARGALPAVSARRRLDSLSHSHSGGGWDSESASASTPRPPPKIPAHLQEVAAAMAAPPPFGLKPLMQGESRPGTGMGTIRPRAGSSATAWGVAGKANSTSSSTQNGGGRSLWGLFTGSGGGADAAPTVNSPKAANDMGVPGGFESDAGAGYDDEGGGGGSAADGDGGGGWTSMGNANGRAQAEKEKEKAQPQQQQQPPPVSIAQRLRRVSDAAATASPASRLAGKAASASSNTNANASASGPTTTAAIGKKGRAAKKGGAKGKKVTIEDVPDEDIDNRGESLPVDSRLILDDAHAHDQGVILEPKPSVPPALFDSIISYTDEEDNNKPVQPKTSWGNSTEAWMSAAAKEIKEGTAKMEKAAAGGVWGSGAPKQHVPWGPTATNAPSFGDTEELSGFFGRASKTAAQPTPGGGSLWGQKGKAKSSADNAEEAAKPTIQNLKRNKAAGGKLF